MGLFHRHHWREAGRTYTPPKGKWKTEGGLSEEMLQVLLQGVTNIELRCEECGDVRVILAEEA